MATILTLFLSLVFGVLLSYTSIPESELSINIIFGASIFVAAFITAHQAGTKGLYYGLSIGLGFIILGLVISAVLWSNAPSWLKIAEKVIIALGAGGIGGIAGVLFPRS